MVEMVELFCAAVVVGVLWQTMSGISQWLKMEEKDFAEPAGFYVPGATHWWNLPKRGLTEHEERELQKLVDLWGLDEDN